MNAETCERFPVADSKIKVERTSPQPPIPDRIRIKSLPLREFWGCDGRRGFAKEIFVVVRAYIDESLGKYKTFALGCVIAKGTEWTWINRDWKK